MSRIEDPRLLAGRVALVSGAAKGMGAAHAVALARCGASVIVGDVDVAGAGTVADQIGSRALAVELDVRSASSWGAAVDAATGRFGAVSILVNNAGIVHREPFADTSEADFRRVLDVNQVGPFLGVQAVLGPMRSFGRGSVVNIASTAALVGFQDRIGYVASKWAVRGMSRALAAELAPWNIRVNTVCPGVIETPMTSGLSAVGGSLLRRRGLPEEVASLVVFLASDLSSYSTGADFVVDGGEVAVGGAAGSGGGVSPTVSGGA